MKPGHNNLKSQLPESLESMILMSASAADLNPADLPDGTAGNDLMISLTPDELLDGGEGHDILIGLGGSNVLRGGGGHDTLISVRGDNVLDGGAGIDKAVYWNGNRADYTVTDHGFGIIEILGDNHSDFITNIEQVQFQDGTYSIAELLSGVVNAPADGDLVSEDAAEQTVDVLKTPTAGDDVLVANKPGEAIDGLAGDDLIVGLGNGNIISGGAGDDALVSAGGSNLIDGGSGTDTVIYTAGVKADYTIGAADGGAISVTSTTGTDILLNVEMLSFQDGTVAVPAAPVVDPVVVVDPAPVVDPVVVVDPAPVVDPVVVVDPVEEEVDVVEVVEEEVVDPVEEEVDVVEVVEEEVVDPVEEEVDVVEVVEEEVIDPVVEEEVDVVEVVEEEVVDPVVEEEVDVVEVVEEEVVDPVVEEEVDVVEEEAVDPVEGVEENDADAPDFSIHMGGNLYATVGSGDDGDYYELKSMPSHGSINFYGNGEFDFHAVPGFSGTVSFQYAVTGANGNVTTKEVAISVQGISPGYDHHVEEPADNGHDEVEVDEVEVDEAEVDEVEVDEVEVDEVEVDEVEVDEEEPVNNNCDIHYTDNCYNVCDVVETVVSCFDGILDNLFDWKDYSSPTYCEPTYTSYNSGCNTSYNSSYNSCYTTSWSWGWSWGSLWGGWCW